MQEQSAAVIDAAGGNHAVIWLLTSVLCYG